MTFKQTLTLEMIFDLVLKGYLGGHQKESWGRNFQV